MARRRAVMRSTTEDARAAGPVRRATQLLVGLVLYAASMALLVHPALGNMPWDVLGQGVALRLGWSLGTATLVLSGAVLLCWVPLRQRPGVGTVANVLVIGVLVDPFLALLARLPDPLPVAARVGLAAGGIAANGLATALYVGARLGPGPRDGLMTGLVARTGWSVRLVRTGIEVAVVLVGFVLGGRVGLGTLAYALAIGPVVHMLLPRFTLAPPRQEWLGGRVAARRPGRPRRPGAAPETAPGRAATPDRAAPPDRVQVEPDPAGHPDDGAVARAGGTGDDAAVREAQTGR